MANTDTRVVCFRSVPIRLVYDEDVVLECYLITNKEFSVEHSVFFHIWTFMGVAYIEYERGNPKGA